MSHSKIPPSSAHVWGAPDGCPGAVRMTENYPDVEIPESLAGTSAHEIGGMMIGQFSRGQEPVPREYAGTTLSNGFLVTMEEYEAARVYAEDVRDVMRSTHIFGGEGVGVERVLQSPEIHPESFGTCDCFIFHRGAGHLWIWEYKHGRGIVEEFENWQIINYLSGITTAFGITGIEDQKITVHARIIQPRAYHRDGPIREWSFVLSDIRRYVTILHDNALTALGPNPATRSGPQCRYCMARHECPAALDAGIRMYEVLGAPIPVKMSAAGLGTFYALVTRAKKAIEYLETGITAEVTARIRAGENIPGCIVQEGHGHQAWTAPAAEIIALGELMGLNLKKEATVSPTEAKKLGLDPAVIETYSGRPSTGFRVVIDNHQKARRIFS